MNNHETIFVHLPAYRDPEIIPTIRSALANARRADRIHFGICRQFHPDDKFDNLDEFRADRRFQIADIPHENAQGLPWARAQVNEHLLGDQDFILQLDSHHRFAPGWDELLIDMHRDLEQRGFRPILTGYLPHYSPMKEPDGRAVVPWQQQFVSFYQHGTIFIRPGALTGFEGMKIPPRSRFLSGHFCFARSAWAREVRHDPLIYFSGEELNLTVRSYTHGWDFFHPHKLVLWHSTMREERQGILKWDDDGRNGIAWGNKQDSSRKRIRVLLQVENDPTIDLSGYDLGTVRSLRDYEKFAGVHFKRRTAQRYTLQNLYPPNPLIKDDALWELSFIDENSVCETNLRLEWDVAKIEQCDDFHFIYFGVEDQLGNVLFRYDAPAQSEEVRLLRNWKDVSFKAPNRPARLVVWPLSKSRGWLKKVEYAL